jgi:hypothetical protein
MTQPTPISGRNCLHLSGLLEQTVAMVAKLGNEFDHYRCKLNELNSRYAEDGFHLAVLGQFKRGNSTLLNALNFLQQYGEIPVFCVSAHKGLDVTTDKVFKTGLQAVWNDLNRCGADQSPPPTKAHRFQ